MTARDWAMIAATGILIALLFVGFVLIAGNIEAISDLYQRLK